MSLLQPTEILKFNNWIDKLIQDTSVGSLTAQKEIKEVLIDAIRTAPPIVLVRFGKLFKLLNAEAIAQHNLGN